MYNALVFIKLICLMQLYNFLHLVFYLFLRLCVIDIVELQLFVIFLWFPFNVLLKSKYV